jgi:inorganic pyrophosphatase
VTHFFDVYKALEHSKTSVTETKGREAAVRIVAQAIARYREAFGNRTRRPTQAG